MPDNENCSPSDKRLPWNSGGNHYWTKNQTWICNIESSSRALLPAEIIGGH